MSGAKPFCRPKLMKNLQWNFWSAVSRSVSHDTRERKDSNLRTHGRLPAPHNDKIGEKQNIVLIARRKHLPSIIGCERVKNQKAIKN